MAEAVVGGAVFGAAVNKLLDEIVIRLQLVKNRDANLHNLDKLLQRLQPFVRELDSFFENCSAEDPAHTWLDHLHQELKTADDLLQDISNTNNGILSRCSFRTSKKLVQLNQNLLNLASEAALAEWASRLSTGSDAGNILAQVATDVAGLRADAERQNQRQKKFLEKIEAVTSQSSHSSTNSRDMMCILTEIATSFSSSESEILNDGSSSSSPSSEEPLLSRTASEVQINVGDEVADEVISLLMNGRKKWVGLWAMGGAGKTFAARKVCRDSQIQAHFAGGIYWVTVSNDQPPKHVLLRQLFRQLFPSKLFPNNEEDARNRITHFLSSRGKVLLVLDDVWKGDILNYLDVISEGKILVTTRDEENLRSVVENVEIFRIPPLSEEHSWQLFSWHAFGVRGKNVPSDVETVAKDVAKECKGLPLALKVIGAAMATKSLFDWEITILDKSLQREWQTVLEQLRNGSVSENQYESLYRRLQLSVDNLCKEDPRLPDCFFYFAAFPEDEDVDIEELVDMWTAEGMVRANWGNLSVSSDVEAKFLLGWLIAKSMIQVSNSGARGEQRCKIHDVMRDLARLNLKNNFSTNPKRRKVDAYEMQCLYQPGLGLPQFPWNTRKTKFCAERLSLRNNSLQVLPNAFNAPNLRVLMLAHNDNLQVLPSRFFRVLSQLRVLNLSYTGIVKVGRNVLRNLKSLVLLDLRGCWDLEKVSDKINGLPNLETIRLDYSPRLQNLPLVMNLTKLKTFSVDIPCQIPAGQWRERMPMLQKRNLRRVLIGSRDVGLLGIGDPIDLYNIPFLAGSKALEELWLRRLSSFPPGMTEFSHLKILGLSAFPEVDSLPAFDRLPFLERLVICDFPSLRTFPESFGREGAFPSIRAVQLMHLPRVEKLFTFQSGTMKGLETLEIDDLPLKELPKFLTVFRSVKRLSIKRSVTSRNTAGNRIENLDCMFSQPNCFPNLESLEIECLGELPNSTSLARLGTLVCDIPREKCPPNILELEKVGQLTIVEKKSPI